MILSRREEFQNKMPVWWYGHSFTYVDRYASAWYPIPFNFLIRWARTAWLRLRYPQPDLVEKIRRQVRIEESLRQQAFWSRRLATETRQAFKDGQKHLADSITGRNYQLLTEKIKKKEKK